MLVISDFSGYFVKVSSSCQQILGYTEEEMCARPIKDFIHPEDIERTDKIAQSFKEKRTMTDFTNRYLAKDGSIVWFLWSGWLDDGLFWGAAHNITQLKKVEEESEQNKKLFEHTLKKIPGTLYQFQMFPNGDVFFSYVSDNIKEIIGTYKSKPPTSMDNFFEDTLPQDVEGMKSAIKKSAADLSEFYHSFRVKTPDGKVRYLEARSTPEKSKDGTIVWNGLLTDITNLTNAKMELELSRTETIHASKMSALGEMAAGIAHEVNNPLAIIHGYADRIIRFAQSGKLEISEATRLAEKILQGTARIEKTVKSLTKLSYSKTDDVFEKKSLHDIIHDTLNISTEKFHSHGIKVQVTKDIKSFLVECVPIEISQTLLNLLNNAFDAVENCPEKWIDVSVKDIGYEIEIRVTDSGPGIPEDMKDRLWQPFFTSKDVGKGTGLGLSISKRLIEKNSGKIWLDKKSEHTAFVIQLPKSQPLRD